MCFLVVAFMKNEKNSEWIYWSVGIVIGLWLTGTFLLDLRYKELDKQMQSNTLPTTEEAVIEPQNEPQRVIIKTTHTYNIDLPTYDIELSADLQKFTILTAHAYDIEPALVFAVMKKESRFDTEAYYLGNYGLMQINHINHSWLTEEIGVTDFMNPEQNVEAGCYILSMLTEKYGDIDKVLMAYNLGEGSAQSMWKDGITETHYSKTVREYYEEFKNYETTKEVDEGTERNIE